jgi:hypothetical protein
MTVAPSSTKTRPQAGPATTLHKSTTVKPDRGAGPEDAEDAEDAEDGENAEDDQVRGGNASIVRQASSVG